MVTTADFRFYPNPAGLDGGWIFLEESYAKDQQTQMEWLDIRGRIVHTQVLDGDGIHQALFPAGGLAPGLYTVRLSNERGGARVGRWSLR